MTSQNVSREPAQRPTADSSTSVAQRTYVLDTSVLLSDPRALFRFAEHAVVLPVVVVSELESKRNDPEIGYFAPGRHSGSSTTCASNTNGSTSRSRSRTAARSASN